MQMCLFLLMCNIQVAVKFRIVDGMDVQCFNQNKGNRFMQQVRQILYISLKVLWWTLASANQTIVQIISLTSLYTVCQFAGTIHRESRPFISNVSIAALLCFFFWKSLKAVCFFVAHAKSVRFEAGLRRQKWNLQAVVDFMPRCRRDLVEIPEDVPRDAVVESRA